MAEKEAKKPDAAAGNAKGEEKKGEAKEGSAKKGGLLSKTPVLLGGVMFLEALVLFAGFKFIMGSQPKVVAAEVTQATDGAGDGKKDGEHGASGEHGAEAKGSGAAKDSKKLVEIPVVEFRAPNKQSGRTFIYDVAIFAVTKGANEEKVKGIFKDREALIKDRIRTIIAQSDPDKLEGGSEPNLDTLRR